MAQDAYVTEADALRGFAADVYRIGEDLAGRSSRLSIVAYQKETELRVYVDRIEAAWRDAEDRWRDAQSAYEDYISYADRDDYSESEAYRLRCEADDARARCSEIRDDLDAAQHILRDAMTSLSGLLASSGGFSSRITELTQTASRNIDAAAYEIMQYKSVR